MSIAKRLLHGTLASAASVGLALVQQMALVPLFLTAWGQERYGVWLAVQSAFTWTGAVTVGHQQYLNGELAKSMPVDAARARSTLASALVAGQLLGAIEWLLFIALAIGNDFEIMGIGPTVAERESLRLVLLIQATAHCLTKPAAGSLHKLLQAKPETHARSIWWASAQSLALTIALVVFAVTGTGLVGAAVGTGIALVVYAIPMGVDVHRRARPFWPSRADVDLRQGSRDLLRSLVVGMTFFVQFSLTNGINLLIAGTTGAAALPLFTTTRTLANALSLGVSMLVFPSTPELVRFEVTKDYAPFVSTLRLTWLVSGAAVNAGALVLATLVAPFYALWTRGEMLFDRGLFSYLALSVCLQALGMPLASLLNGMNRLRACLIMALVKAGLTAAVSFVLVSRFGTQAFGMGLVAAELCGTLAIPFLSFRQSLPAPVWGQVWRGARLPSLGASCACAVLLAQALGAPVLLTSAGGIAAVLGLSVVQVRSLPPAIRGRIWNLLPGRRG